jgi:exodeoxyribonuclease-3
LGKIYRAKAAGVKEPQISCRIDCHIGTSGIAATAKTASINKQQRFSDHAPLTIDGDF